MPAGDGVPVARLPGTPVRLKSSDGAGVYRGERLAPALMLYPIVVLIQAPNKAGAAAFVAYVRSPAGAATLTAYGFQQP